MNGFAARYADANLVVIAVFIAGRGYQYGRARAQPARGG
jgi:hypothetical protein